MAERTDEAAERARGAREWISAWKASNKAGGAGVDAAAAEVSGLGGRCCRSFKGAEPLAQGLDIYVLPSSTPVMD